HLPPFGERPDPVSPLRPETSFMVKENRMRPPSVQFHRSPLRGIFATQGSQAQSPVFKPFFSRY
ncbi:MAG: hypothetical protein AAAB19_27995, partial [Rhizobium sp.]